MVVAQPSGGGAGDDDFDDSFEGAFGGGPGDENPMTQVRRRRTPLSVTIGRASALPV